MSLYGSVEVFTCSGVFLKKLNSPIVNIIIVVNVSVAIMIFFIFVILFSGLNSLTDNVFGLGEGGDFHHKC